MNQGLEAGGVEAVIARSWVMRGVDAAFLAPANAWQHSRVRPFVDATRATVAASPAPQRIELAGRMLGVAAITRASLSLASGETASAPTIALWAFVLIAALFMAKAGRQVAAAWRAWKGRMVRHPG